jgi:hypothetical protein
VLWGAQGRANVETMEWLQSKECDMTLVNNNGHGFLHKAAQRGQADLVEWFIDRILLTSPQSNPEILYNVIGPDTEGYCPSDLAGMEGHEELAVQIAQLEMNTFERIWTRNVKPRWAFDFEEIMKTRISEKELYLWEKHGGIRRMGSALVKLQKL